MCVEDQKTSFELKYPSDQLAFFCCQMKSCTRLDETEGSFHSGREPEMYIPPRALWVQVIRGSAPTSVSAPYSLPRSLACY